MIDSRVLADLDMILSHFFVDSITAVRQWSRAECDDCQMPLAIVLSFLTQAAPPTSKGQYRIKNRPEHMAAVDIVTNSSLNQLIEYCADRNVIKYRAETPTTLKEEIAIYIAANSEAFH
jgi:hypothetical protein